MKQEKKQFEESRFGSGNLWQNKLTMPIEPQLRSKERSRQRSTKRLKFELMNGADAAMLMMEIN